MPQCQFISHKDTYDGSYVFVRRDKNREVTFHLHYHDFYEVQIYTSDAGTLLLDGKEHKVVRGDIALINIFSPHTLIINPKTYYDRICVDLSPDMLFSSCSKNTNLLNIFSKSNSKFPIYHLKGDYFQRILATLDKFSQINLSHGRDIMERALMYEFLANLYDIFYEDNLKHPGEEQSMTMVITLIKYINDHLVDDLSLDRLAEEVKYSKFHVCRIFKKFTGTTLNKYIITKRIENAKYLLGDSMPISDVSKMAGFNNYSYFYKTFKSIYDISPTDYRINTSR